MHGLLTLRIAFSSSLAQRETAARVYISLRIAEIYESFFALRLVDASEAVESEGVRERAGPPCRFYEVWSVPKLRKSATLDQLRRSNFSKQQGHEER
jgi:hypothetical protein